MASNDPTDDYLFRYLKHDMQATTDEIDYVKRLYQLKCSKSRRPIDNRFSQCPSLIIDDFLYHGDYIDASDIKALNELGIRHILSVCDLSLEPNILDHFNVLRIDVDDIDEFDISQHFNQTNAFLYECKSKNEKVLVHCQAGISRSSVIVLAYLLKHHKETLYEAYDYLTERRSLAKPNKGFFLQLVRYEKDLHKVKTNENTCNLIEST